MLKHECDVAINPKGPEPVLLAPENPGAIVPHSVENYGASIASGSYPLGRVSRIHSNDGEGEPGAVKRCRVSRANSSRK